MNYHLIGKFEYNNYNFYITKNENEKINYWIKQDKKLRIINNEAHRKLIQEVIKELNNYRHMLIGNINFKGESYIWYVNRYIPQSIFVNQRTKEICKYEENKELYEKYNLNPNIVYISENTKKYFNENIKPKAKIIKVAILGVIISVALTSNGTEFLSRNKIDENSFNNNQQEIDITDIDDIQIGTTTEILEKAIYDNKNLTQEEKEFIDNNFEEFFEDTKQYMNEEQIVDILETLRMKYENKEYLKDGATAGDYHPVNNEITFYTGNNIEEVIDDSKIVPMHEVFHSLQSFGFGKIDEGVTELYSEEYGGEKSTQHYPNEKNWAKLMVEVFGKDLVLQESINNGRLPEHISEKVTQASDNITLNKVRNNILDLISDINDSIEYIENKKYSVFLKNSQENIEDEQKIESVFDRLEDYDKILNGRNYNKMIDIYKDVILKTNSSCLLENDNEYISNVHKNYFANTNDVIRVEISNNNGGYLYQKRDEQGNVIQSGKIPYRNVVIDIDGNILYKEEYEITAQNILEEYKKIQGDYER